MKRILTAAALTTSLLSGQASANNLGVTVNNYGSGSPHVTVIVNETQPSRPQVLYGNACFARNSFTGQWVTERLITPVPSGSPCTFSLVAVLSYGFTHGVVIAQ